MLLSVLGHFSPYLSSDLLVRLLALLRPQLFTQQCHDSRVPMTPKSRRCAEMNSTSPARYQIGRSLGMLVVFVSDHLRETCAKSHRSCLHEFGPVAIVHDLHFDRLPVGSQLHSRSLHPHVAAASTHSRPLKLLCQCQTLRRRKRHFRTTKASESTTNHDERSNAVSFSPLRTRRCSSDTENSFLGCSTRCRQR